MIADLAAATLVGVLAGWVLGYGHRSLIAYGAALAGRVHQRRQRAQLSRGRHVAGRDPLPQVQHAGRHPQHL